MENLEPQITDYLSLTKKGLQLHENDFNLIRDSLIAGSIEAKKFLNITPDSWPKFIFSNDIATMGYSIATDAICLSIDNLNQQVARITPLEYKDQLILFIPDVFYIITKYLYWLRLLGRESTIHRYQKIGNPQLHVQFLENFPSSFSSKLLLLSSLEVEARTITDKIAVQQGENPLWQNVDNYFAQNYPEYHNKSIDDLAKLAKPNLPISVEMEYYLIS